MIPFFLIAFFIFILGMLFAFRIAKFAIKIMYSMAPYFFLTITAAILAFLLCVKYDDARNTRPIENQSRSSGSSK